MTSATPEVAFVFPGGGSTGAAQVGILSALSERGVVPDVLVGCSVGALNAAFFAQDPTTDQVRRLADIWLRIGRAEVFGVGRTRSMARLVMRRDHVYSPEPLQALISRFFHLEDLSDASVALQIVTTDLELGVARWWSRGPAAEILYASACLPGLLPPIVLDGHRHIDGGVLEPVPVQRAVDLDADTVYLLGETLGPSDYVPPRLTALEVLIRAFAVSRYARLPDPVSLARRGQRVVVVPGATVTGLAITDFSHTSRLIRDSRDRAHRFLDRWDDSGCPTAAMASVGGRAPKPSTSR